MFGEGLDKPQRVAVVGVRPPKEPIAVEGITILSIDDLMRHVKAHFQNLDPMKQAVCRRAMDTFEPSNSPCGSGRHPGPPHEPASRA